MKKLPFLFLFLQGCLLPFYPASVLEPGEMAVGIGAGVSPGEEGGDFYCENSILFVRKGFGNGWEGGISLGIPYLSFDVRRELWKYPYITLTCGPIFYYALLGSGYGTKGNLQIGDNISLNLGAVYSVYTYEIFLSAERYTSEAFTLEPAIKFHDEFGNWGGSIIIGCIGVICDGEFGCAPIFAFPLYRYLRK